MTERSRKPTAFRLDDANVVVTDPRQGADRPADDLAAVLAEIDAAEDARRPLVRDRRWHWGTVFFAALGGLLTLAVGIAVDQLIRDLFARADWLGWLGAALAALLVVAALAVVVREIVGMVRLGRIDRLRQRAEAAAEADDSKLAASVLDDVVALYRDRADTARGRAALTQHRGEIIDGRDRITLAERDLMRPLDREARRMVTESAKRVSVVTAVSPRALIDLLFVLAESLRLIRRLSTLYGGRPGGLGFVRLTRQVIGHLAVTGAIAVGDSLIHGIVGQGLAARLSARLGEGVVNGLLTARIGIAAIDVCRPLPFLGETRPKVGDVLSELMTSTNPDTAPQAGKTRRTPSGKRPADTT